MNCMNVFTLKSVKDVGTFLFDIHKQCQCFYYKSVLKTWEQHFLMWYL